MKTRQKVLASRLYSVSRNEERALHVLNLMTIPTIQVNVYYLAFMKQVSLRMPSV